MRTGWSFCKEANNEKFSRGIILKEIKVIVRDIFNYSAIIVKADNNEFLEAIPVTDLPVKAEIKAEFIRLTDGSYVVSKKIKKHDGRN